MKRLLTFLFLAPIFAYGQNPADSSAYKKRKLKLDEVNFVHGYYQQSGQNAAVDGGVGDEALMDISNVISVTLLKGDKKGREHSMGVKVGIDYYTSASSDRIDPRTISSASSADVRVYPSLTWNMYNESKRREFGANLAFSAEYDYTSSGFGVSYGGHSKNKNSNWVLRAQAYIDQWSLIYPIELRGREELSRSDRSSYSGSFVLSQVVNKRLQVAIMADYIHQAGLLSTPYHRFFFEGASLPTLEKLPEQRAKFPVGARLNYFLGDRMIIKSWARYYSDNWNLKSTTYQVEVPIKLTSFLSLYPFYRGNQQSGIDYFHERNSLVQGAADFYTSDFDLSSFTSDFYGIGFRWAPPGGLFSTDKIKLKWSELGLRYGHYERSTGLSADIISLHLKIKPTN